MSITFNLYRSSDGSLKGSNPQGDIGESGYLRFTNTKYTASGTGNLTITVERYGGSSGTLSGSITQSAANRASGKFTPTPIAVSFADGEAGIKSYTFNVTTAPTDGPYWMNLALTVGATQPRHWWDYNSEIEVNDGVSVPTVDTANVFEVGPAGDYTTINAAARAVQAPALILIRGGTYADEDNQGDGLGINPGYSGDRTNRIIYKAYPGETPVIEADSSITDMTTQIPTNGAILLRGSRAVGGALNGLVFSGLTIKSASFGIQTFSDSSYHENIIVEDCTIFDVGTAANNNTGGVRWDDAKNCAVRNCRIYNIYEGNSLHLDAHDNNACIHGYRGTEIVIEDNILYNAAHTVYHKNAPTTTDNETGYIIRRNQVNECYTAFRFEDNYVGKGIPQNFDKVDIYHNISSLSSMIDCQTQKTFHSSKNLWIYGNNCIDDIGSLGGFRDTEVYNNIVITASDTFAWPKQDVWIDVASNPYDPANSATWPNPADPASTNVAETGTASFFDYNVYWSSINIQLAKNGSGAQTFTTLAGWQGAADTDILAGLSVGASSALTDPGLDINDRATNPLPAGRFGLDIGVPASVAVGGTT